MPDNGHFELTWSWGTLFPLATVVVLLLAAVWPLPHRVRIIMALVAIATAWIFTAVQGPGPWATLANAVLANWGETLVTLLVIFAIGLVVGRKK